MSRKQYKCYFNDYEWGYDCKLFGYHDSGAKCKECEFFINGEKYVKYYLEGQEKYLEELLKNSNDGHITARAIELYAIKKTVGEEDE